MNSKKVKNIGCIGGILLIFVLLCNTNNNPTSFLMRILPPIMIGGTRFYYGNLLFLIAIYFIIKALYKINEWSFLNSGGKRFLCWILVLAFIGVGCEDAVKVYKFFQVGLKAIYLDREKTNLSVKYNTEDKGNQTYRVYEISGYITVENCSNLPTKPFKIRLNNNNLDEDFNFQTCIEEYQNKDQEYLLSPKQKMKIQLDSTIKLEDTNEKYREQGLRQSARRTEFEVVLYSDTEEVIFEEQYK